MPIFTWRAAQGEGIAETVTFAADFVGTETLAGTISDGSTGTAKQTFTPTWAPNQTANFYTQAQVAIDATTTAALPPGFYVVQITLANSTAILAYGTLEVFSAPSEAPPLDAFASPAQVIGLMPELKSNVDQIAALPHLLSAATEAIRRYLMGQKITQGVIIEELPVALNGYVRLSQIPVNSVLSVQAFPGTALTITNGSAQTAQAIWAFTGDVSGGQVIAGLQLNWTTNGTAGTTILQFTAGETIGDLATAINGVGSGWSATAVGMYSTWAVTELYGGYTGQGAANGVSADFFVYSQPLADLAFHPDDGQKTGMLWVGNGPSTFAGQWGPYPLYDDLAANNESIVRVSYNYGYATVPYILQHACVETVRAMLLRLKTNPYVTQEKAGEVSISLAYQSLMALPLYVLQEVASFRVTNA